MPRTPEQFQITKKQLSFLAALFCRNITAHRKCCRLGEIMEIAMPILKMLPDYFDEMGYKNPEGEARLFVAMLDGILLSSVYDPESFPMRQIENRLINMHHPDN